MILALMACSDDSPTATESASNTVSWDAGHVTLQADDFRIEVGGMTYLGNVDSVFVGGDPGGSANNSLETEWTEHDTSMRLYMYFESADGDWWCYEIRTYDGSESGDWVYYYGEFFKSPVGHRFYRRR